MFVHFIRRWASRCAPIIGGNSGMSEVGFDQRLPVSRGSTYGEPSWHPSNSSLELIPIVAPGSSRAMNRTVPVGHRWPRSMADLAGSCTAPQSHVHRVERLFLRPGGKLTGPRRVCQQLRLPRVSWDQTVMHPQLSARRASANPQDRFLLRSKAARCRSIRLRPECFCR
jgi:hypothetical protein